MSKVITVNIAYPNPFPNRFTFLFPRDICPMSCNIAWDS